MANVKIELKYNENKPETFEDFQILSWTTTTTCTNNLHMPVFDAFPNSGQVVLKDSDLSIYENAINGLYDEDYNFEVDIYIDNKKIAHHIVNQQPYYNYEEKTLTLNLGNELDINNDLIYEGYSYPLEPQSFATIFVNIIRKILNIDEDKIKNILRDKQYNVDNAFNIYFDGINIEYPYLSSKLNREALQNLLTIAKCSMYLDENKLPVFVRMDGGYSGSRDDNMISTLAYNNVNFILPEQMREPFIPSIIQTNKFNVAEIFCNNINEVQKEGEIFSINFDVAQSDLKETDNRTVDYEASYGIYHRIDGDVSFEYTTDGKLTGSFLTSSKVIYLNNKTIKNSIYTNNNLVKALTPLTPENFSIAIAEAKIIKTTSTGDLYFSPGDNPDGIYVHNGNYYFEETGTPNSNEETVFGYNITKDIEYENLKLTILNINENIANIFVNADGEIKYTFNNKYVGFEFLYFHFNEKEDLDDGIQTEHYKNVSCEKIKIIPTKLNLSLNCKYLEKEFNGKTLTAPSDISNQHKMTISTGGGLMQYVGDNITEVSFPVAYAIDLLGWYKGGIKTGQLSVIKDNYNNYKGAFGEAITINETLKQNGSITRNNNRIKANGIYTLHWGSTGKYTIFNNAQTPNGLKIRISEGVIKITYTGTGSILINEITPFMPNGTVDGESQKIFKVGDLIVPCKDYEWTPIVTNNNGHPVIYQVVEAETFGEGGAVFQNLQIRQVKTNKESALPYSLVANESGITIIIKDNGYATEGKNNEIIRIGWQT